MSSVVHNLTCTSIKREKNNERDRERDTKRERERKRVTSMVLAAKASWQQSHGLFAKILGDQDYPKPWLVPSNKDWSDQRTTRILRYSAFPFFYIIMMKGGKKGFFGGCNDRLRIGHSPGHIFAQIRRFFIYFSGDAFYAFWGIKLITKWIIFLVKAW